MHVCPNSASMSCTAHDKSPFRHLSARLPRRESLAVAIQYPQELWPVSSLRLSSRSQACPFRCAIPGKSPPKLSLSLSLSLSLLLPLKVSASAYLPYTRAPDLQWLRKTARMSRRTAAILVPVAGAGSEPWRTSCVTGNVGSGLRPWVSHASKEKRHDEENLGF